MFCYTANKKRHKQKLQRNEAPMKITALLSPSTMWVKVDRQGRVYFRSAARTDCNFPLGFIFLFKQDDGSRHLEPILQMKEIKTGYIEQNPPLYHHHHHARYRLSAEPILSIFFLGGLYPFSHRADNVLPFLVSGCFALFTCRNQFCW